MEVWSDRGFTCKFRNARSAFRNLHVDPLSLHTSMRNKQVEFNPYIYTLTTLSKLYVLATKYPFFNTKHPVINQRASLFVVTPAHVASWKIECQNFCNVYRSRKHWKCKYYCLKNEILLLLKQEPQGTLIAHLSTMSTSVKSYISKQMINQKAWLPYLWNQSE